MFRYEWATAAVTVPKDETEYEAWRRESMELSKPYCEEDWIWQFEADGTDYSVTDLVFHNRSLFGMIGIVLHTDGEFNATDVIDTAEEAPVVTINGVRLYHLGEIDPNDNIVGNVSSDHHRKGYMMVGYATADLPEEFTLTVTWNGSTVEIPLKRADVMRRENAPESVYDEVFNY